MPYDANTNWENERSYLNNLVSQGGGNATWAQNQLGVLNAAEQAFRNQSSSPVNINKEIGSFQNALDMITGLSDKASARSLDYAMQNQEWSAQQAEIARNFNAAEAAKNRDWQMFMSSTAHQREIDEIISRYAEGWKLSRIAKSTLAILRCAICEILYLDDVPNSAAVNEAVELGKTYDSPQAGAFINGLLGSFLRDEKPAPET